MWPPISISISIGSSHERRRAVPRRELVPPRGTARRAKGAVMTPPVDISAGTRLLALAAMRCTPGAPRLSHDELREHLSTLAG